MREDSTAQSQADDPRRWRRHFFPLWVGQAFSLVGSRVVQFALVWWLTQETGSATILATASMVALVPEIAIGPLAGAYVDRWQRKAVMLAADTIIALASLLLAYLFWADLVQVWHIYGLLFIRALGGSFHWPAMQSSTSLMVPERHLTRVAGANQTLNGALTVIAPPLGALLLEVLPMAAVMLVDVGTAVLAIVPLFFIVVPQPVRQAAASGAQSVWREVRMGLAYVRGWPGLLALIAISLVIKLALTPAFTLLPLLVSEYFLGSAADLALLQAVSGIGMVAGGLLLSTWGGFKRRIYTAMSGVVALGLGLSLVGLAPADAFSMAVVGGLVIGLTIPLIDGPIVAILQSTVDPAMQGRVFTLLGSLLALSSPVGLAVAGPAGDLIGVRFWFVLASVLCVVTGAGMFFLPAMVQIEANRRPTGASDGPPDAPGPRSERSNQFER